MRIVLVSFLVGMLLLVSGAAGRDEFIEVTHQQLLEYPQKYWSQGIIFKDELVSPPKGRPITLGDKAYIPFKTANLGTCYAEEEMVSTLESSAMNTDYIFQGTVLHQASSFFSRSPSFYVVVQRLAKAVDGVEQAQERLFADAVSRSSVVDDIITQIQQDLISYAQKNDVDMNALFSVDYENKAVVNNIIYAGIAAVEQQHGTTSRSLLGDFIREVFSAEYSAGGNALLVSKTDAAGLAEGANALSTLRPLTVPTVSEMEDVSAQPDEEADIRALRKRAAIMLKPGISLPARSQGNRGGAQSMPSLPLIQEPAVGD